MIGIFDAVQRMNLVKGTGGGRLKMGSAGIQMYTFVCTTWRKSGKRGNEGWGSGKARGKLA